MKQSAAEILREYGPFADVDNQPVTGGTGVEGDLWPVTWEPKRANCAASIRTPARSSKA